MAHIIKDEEQVRISIYVILFPNTRSFFIGKTLDGKLEQIYKQHYYGEIKKTKEAFLRAKESGKNPPMYCVETVETYQEEAFYHCVAWVKYFLDKGYISLCGENLDQYAKELREESRVIYNHIKEITIEEICPDGEDLFPSYGRKRKKKTDADHSFIGFRVSPEEGLRIKNAASDAGLTTSEYCKRMVLNGRAIIIDQSVFRSFTSCVDEFVERDSLLKQILAAIYETRTYYPADLAIVQEAVESNAQRQKETFQEIKGILDKLLE